MSTFDGGEEEEDYEDFESFAAAETGLAGNIKQDYPRELRRNRDIKKVNAILRKLAQNEKTNELNCDIVGRELSCKLDEELPEDKKQTNELSKNLKQCESDKKKTEQDNVTLHKELEKLKTEFSNLESQLDSCQGNPEETQEVLDNTGGILNRLGNMLNFFNRSPTNEDKYNKEQVDKQLKKIQVELNTRRLNADEQVKELNALKQELSNAKENLKKADGNEKALTKKVKRLESKIENFKKNAAAAGKNSLLMTGFKAISDVLTGAGTAAKAAAEQAKKPAADATAGDGSGSNSGDTSASEDGFEDDAVTVSSESENAEDDAVTVSSESENAEDDAVTVSSESENAEDDAVAVLIENILKDALEEGRHLYDNPTEIYWDTLFNDDEHLVQITFRKESNGNLEYTFNGDTKAVFFWIIKDLREYAEEVNFMANKSGHVSDVTLFKPVVSQDTWQMKLERSISRLIPKDSKNEGSSAFLIHKDKLKDKYTFRSSAVSHQDKDFSTNPTSRKIGKSVNKKPNGTFKWTDAVSELLHNEIEIGDNFNSVVVTFKIFNSPLAASSTSMHVHNLRIIEENHDLSSFGQKYVNLPQNSGTAYMFQFDDKLKDDVLSLINKLQNLDFTTKQGIGGDGNIQIILQSLYAVPQRDDLIARGIVSKDKRYYAGGFIESEVTDDVTVSQKKLRAAFRALYETMQTTRDKIWTKHKSDPSKASRTIGTTFDALQIKIRENIQKTCGKEAADQFEENVFAFIGKASEETDSNDAEKDDKKNDKKFLEMSNSYKDPLENRRLFNAITNVLVTENELGDDWASLWEMAHKFHVLRAHIYRQMNNVNYDYKPFAPPLITGGEEDSSDSDDEAWDAFDASLQAEPAATKRYGRRGRNGWGGSFSGSGSANSANSVDRLAAMFL